jgi:hypothetical protein
METVFKDARLEDARDFAKPSVGSRSTLAVRAKFVADDTAPEGLACRTLASS